MISYTVNARAEGLAEAPLSPSIELGAHGFAHALETALEFRVDDFARAPEVGDLIAVVSEHNAVKVFRITSDSPWEFERP